MEHRAIQQLSPSLVNRIAAGEVIERPAAVVKELVENSLDAGATHVLVEIEDGGRALIRVTDDGAGITPQDLRLAFASHATSKLADDEDLFRITTMGFRGEALASIGAVSQARVLSRTAEGDSAYEVLNRGGAVGDVQSAAGNVGTAVEVRNLFYNTPARRKFIKGAGTEFGHISETVQRLALPHPSIHFKLLHNGRTALDLPPTTAQERFLAAWPEEFREQRLAVEAHDAEMRLGGIIGLPELARPTAKYQYLYINGRSVRDRFIQHALREAYRGLTEPGRHPAAVLLLQLPPQDVDVNVHPTKTEVRFRDSGRVHGLVLSAVREVLLGNNLAPSAAPTDGDESPRQDLRQKLAEFFRQLPPGIKGSHQPAPPLTAQAFSAGGGQAGEGVGAPATFSAGRASLEAAKPQAAIQLHNSYLVAESADGMIIIDQHALHERIMYEELLARLQRGPLESQRLLIPQPVNIPSSQAPLLEQIQPLLNRLGIELTAFGPNTVAVQSFPSFLEKVEPGAFLCELLERGEQELLDLHDEELLHEVLDMMACKAAVKAGDPLSAGEIEALLARRELIERSSNCPHGRPTTLRLSLKDLEKQFKRTGF